MMIKKLSVLLVTGTLLAACGGGGGGTGQGGSINPWGGGGSTTSSDNVISIKKSELDKGFNDDDASRDQGYKIVLNGDKGEKIELYRTNDLKEAGWDMVKGPNNSGYLKLDKNGDPILDDNGNVAIVNNGNGYLNTVSLHGSIAEASDKNDSNSTFGFAANVGKKLEDLDKELYWTAYSGGNATLLTEMPKGITATYTGQAIGADSRFAGTGKDHLKSAFDDQLNENHYGKATITVNFRNRDMTGKLTFNSDAVSDVDLKGKVNGNRFTGTANNGQESVDMQGQFNGTAAKELAGHYQSDKKDGMIGSFAGKRPTK